eukprot:2389153-Alexandrium_andersonii.AAC.1
MARASGLRPHCQALRMLPFGHVHRERRPRPEARRRLGQLSCPKSPGYVHSFPTRSAPSNFLSP